MTIIKQNVIQDAGSVDGLTGAVVSGCQETTPTRTGLGTYELKLKEPLDAKEGVVSITPRGLLGGPSGTYLVDWASDDTLKVQMFAGGLPTDVNFDFVIYNLVGV